MDNDTNEILLLHIIKDKCGLFSIIENNIEQYKKQSGIWTMWGKDNFNTDICLEVAQTRDIFKELQYDLSYLTKVYIKENTRKRYSARRLFEFNQKFSVCECDSNRTCAKYRDIASSYFEVCVYLICNSNETREKRESMELKYAIDNKALYWNAWGKQRKDAKMYYSKKIIK
ncbi:hypothetical protein [[Clostridium] fimetarium]|uniref:Uncharacterized protein n=1 Tax=[Clostridium] fimetarium TaxID=99656 RepID=A0A1I0NG29_9FIRM|nr:hypothetical protein [[Clostridium] fimetarium]SEW00406.1 hypothetical protein SAMN05421659_10384 [[Clostridium] fimetarium]